MGTRTLDQFRTELRFSLDNRADTSADGLSDERIDRWVNATYIHLTHPSIHLHREVQHDYTIPLVTDQNEYTYDPDPNDTTIKITSLRDVHHIDAGADTPTARRVKLQPRGIRWFDKRTITTGEPKIYAIDGSSLFIDGVPGTPQNGELLKIRAWREPALLVDDDDTTVIPALWDEVMDMGILWRAERALKMHEDAAVSKVDYASMINEYASKLWLETEDTGWNPGVVTEEVAP